MNTVRIAIPEDVPFIESILAALYARHAGCFPGIPYCQATTSSTILATIIDPNGIVLVSPWSACGANLTRFPWNQQAIMGTVLFWGFSDRKGIKIIGAMARLLKQSGATHFVATSHWPEFRTKRLYRRLGLQPSELHCIARL